MKTKEFKVLEISRVKDGNSKIGEHENFRLMQDGKYTSIRKLSAGTVTLQMFLNDIHGVDNIFSGHFAITKVKFFSSGTPKHEKVFSVGDEFFDGNIIESFTLTTDGYIDIKTKNKDLDYFQELFSQILNDIRKVPIIRFDIPKKPLFTTYDGVDIFDKDTVVYYVNKNKPQIFNQAPISEKIEKGYWIFCHAFSSREEAEIHIIKNKKVFSFEDVYAAMYLNKGFTSVYEVYELAKQRCKVL